MAARGPRNGRRGLERGPTKIIGRYEQLSLNKFFDSGTASMTEKSRKRMMEIVATNVVAS